jgi:hypothetical protein
MFKETVSMMKAHNEYSEGYELFINNLYQHTNSFLDEKTLFDNFDPVLYIEKATYGKFKDDKRMLHVIFDNVNDIKRVREILGKYSASVRNEFAHGMSETMKLDNFDENPIVRIFNACIYIDELEGLWVKNLEKIFKNYSIFDF